MLLFWYKPNRVFKLKSSFCSINFLLFFAMQFLTTLFWKTFVPGLWRNLSLFSAMMVGISTPAGRLESREFDPIVGEDEHSWGLSHSGCLFHAGQQRKYCEPFAENVPTVIGVLFDGRDPAGGSLSFFKDGKNLGVAFTQLNPGNRHELYPMVSSTAAKTSMRVQNMRREYKSLRDRCRDAVLSGIAQPSDVQTTLDRIPRGLREYILQQLWKIDERLGNWCHGVFFLGFSSILGHRFFLVLFHWHSAVFGVIGDLSGSGPKVSLLLCFFSVFTL